MHSNESTPSTRLNELELDNSFQAPLLYEVDRNALKEWLLSFAPSQIVGYPNLSTDCPLRYFLKRVDPTIHRVYLTEVNYGGELRVLPFWASEWIRMMTTCYSAIRADHALQILEECS